MSSFVQFKYKNNDKDLLNKISEWNYGKNWPVVYIYYNDSYAYVGETLDAVNRTEQHQKEESFDDFSDLCFISNKTFNKSVILDLEAFLIKYMSAEKTLKNVLPGIVDHNYFYKEAYEDDFKEIWNHLLELGIVHRSLADIENSELFKYSPYKSLTEEQQAAAYGIIKRISEINNASDKSIIEIKGGAGTGKSILAVYLIKLLYEIQANKEVWKYVDNIEAADAIKHISAKLSGIKKIGFVVPMVELRNTMKSIFKTIDGLSDKMIYSPEEVTKDYFDVLVVDEAHRLYKRKHLPGAHLYTKFDNINKSLMGDSFQGNENDLTELDWIIKSSRIQVLFYDGLQTIRATDIGQERFDNICKPHLYKYYELLSQMRCEGGNGYYDYVKKILFEKNLSPKDYQNINDYELEVVDSVDELFKKIKEKDNGDNLCKVVCGPGWSIEEDIIIEGKTYHWVKDIISIHKIQGFDLNYAGVIFGKEIIYNYQEHSIEVNKSELRDSFTKSAGDENMRQYILNIYLTLMTRGIHGTYIYACDKHLRDYLKEYIND